MTPDPVPGAGRSSAQSVPSQHPAASAVPGTPPRSGTVAWAMGFLAYIPIPIVGLIVAGLTQLFVGLAQRKHGGLAATNGVRAANWGLTQLCWPVLMLIVAVISITTGEPSPTGGVYITPVMEGFMVAVAVLFLVVGLLQVIYAIVGTVQASKGREVRLPVIPFLRAPRG